MKRYKQLGQQQRYVIGRLLLQGKTQKEIADILGCHKSTICRELKRNTPARGPKANIYDPDKAQIKTIQRHREKPKHTTFTQDMRKQIVKLLTYEKLSPELITRKARQQNPDFVSHETIYQWIWKMKHSNRREDQPYRLLYRELKHGRRRRKRGNYHDNRGCIPYRVSIENRPAIVEKRSRIGDMEVDLMLGKNHQPGLLVITDRASLKTTLIKISTKAAKSIARSIIGRMKPHAHWLKTFTYDNDLAFAMHTMVNQQLKTKSFFTHPYTSQEKGTVEKQNRCVAQILPQTNRLLQSVNSKSETSRKINQSTTCKKI
ncbi:MAG: IS30 family transposase [candidate division WOR-3 bacterium]